MDGREANLAKDKMVADLYARTYAAAISANDNGVIPAVEAKQAVKKFIEMMKVLSAPEWMWYKENEL